VVARIRARLRTYDADSLPSTVLQAGGLEMDIGRYEVTVNGAPVSLTATEFNLLRVLLENSGYVLTRADLIRKALGGDYDGLDRTLDSHVRNLRRKIEPNHREPTYIHTVYGVGYRLSGDGK
jgi:two-component system alkaline phosphatase synthesis response regulator PhoP